jgi:putative ABC transport system substrate-binding protein
MGGTPETHGPNFDAFRRGMAQAGWREGENIRYEVRWGRGELQAFDALARELVALRPAVLMAGSSPGAVAVVKAARGAIPVVTQGDDPVRLGLVRSHARPGGNVTGTSPMFAELSLKQLEALLRVRPGAKRIGVLVNTADKATMSRFTESEPEMRKRAQIVVADVRNAAEIAPAIQRLARDKVEGLIVPVTILFNVEMAAIARLALEARIPAVFAVREAVEHGALMSYGVDIAQMNFRAAESVDRILRGANPADMPIEFINEVEVSLNMGTARRLGITFPADILLRAVTVIE